MKTPVIVLLAFASLAHAAGPIFSTILGGSGQDYAGAVLPIRKAIRMSPV